MVTGVQTCALPIFPGTLGDQVRAAAGDAAAVREIGVQYAAAMCERLLAEGTPGLHFFTLNGSRATREIYQHLGLAGRAAGGSAHPARLRLAAEA
jgi:methylenetetrahydrofolate reductase (NADPH)